MADAISSVRRAQAAGADLVPEAAWQLQLARDEIRRARSLMAEGKNEAAYDEALRAGTDADLALALVHKTEARKAVEQRAHADQRAGAEEQLRVDAERWAARAAADLAGIASLQQDKRGTVITLSGSTLFDNADAELLPGASAKLSRVAEILRAREPEATFVVEGHTDSRGRSADNRALSVDRANAVRDYLIEHGIAPDRICAEGHGERFSLGDNRTADGRANNRRVEIVVKPGASG
jgi:outer membrane protein OmpA-like peptidoglycan-associated protein